MDIKNKKVCLNDNVAEASNDRISSLPDAILQHILSFVDIKLGVQTCVLSKRWQCVWTDVPCLNFNLIGYPRKPATFSEERRNSFVNFMDQVLSRRCSSDIHKFSCDVGAAIDLSRLRLFIDHALQHNVQILEITYSNMVIPPNRKPKIFLDPFEISHTMFTSKSLSVLKLTARNDGGRGILLPGTLSCITLKELHLKQVYLSDGDGTYHMELISDCPNLKYLTLVACHFGELESLNISATQLAKLEILSPRSAVDTQAIPWKCNIIVSAPNLSSFKYEARVPLACSMGNPLNIDAIDINIWKFYKTKSKRYDEEMGRRMTAMLLEFQHAKSVTLSSRALKLLTKDPGMEYSNSSPFCNLKNLRVNLEDASFRSGLNHILNNSPKAKTTMIARSYWFNKENMQHGVHFRSFSSC